MKVKNHFGTRYCCPATDKQAATMRETRWAELRKQKARRKDSAVTNKTAG